MEYKEDTIRVVMLFSLSLIPYALSLVMEAVFQAWEQMEYIAIVQFIGGGVRIGGVLIVLSMGHHLDSVIVVFIASHILVFLIELFIIVTRLTHITFKIDFAITRDIVSRGRDIIGINSVLAFRSSFGVIIVTKFVGETGTGLYSAATQFSVPIFLVLQSVAKSVFPIMSRAYDKGIDQLQRVSTRLFEILLIITIPASVGLAVMSTELLLFIYDAQEFGNAASILQITSWSLIGSAFTHALGRVLFASNNERLSLRITIIVSIVWFASQIVLTKWYGTDGAAISVLIAVGFNVFCHYVAVSRYIFHIRLIEVIWKPIVSSAMMVGVITLIRDLHVLIVIAVAGIVYFITWSLLTAVTLRSFELFKRTYIRVWNVK